MQSQRIDSDLNKKTNCLIQEWKRSESRKEKAQIENPRSTRDKERIKQWTD